MKIEIRLDDKGNAFPSFMTAANSRKIDLSSSNLNEVHPFQALGPAWIRVIHSLGNFSDKLQIMEMHLHTKPRPDSASLLNEFRSLIYSATELFDIYSQLIPNRLGINRGRNEQKLIKKYATSCKRLRNPTAILCNKFKHGSRQLALTSVVSDVSGHGCFGFMVTAYRDGDALVRDEDVHKRPESSAAFRKRVNEIVHALLRVDYNASLLLGKLSENSPTELTPPSEPLIPSKLVAEFTDIVVYMSADEGLMFDGLELEGAALFLTRKAGIILPDPSRRTTTLQGDGVTRKFTFA